MDFDFPHLTAYLKVDFKAPMKPDTTYYCLATITRREGDRKVFVNTEVTDDTGKVYALGEAL
jgi:acyl-coenzyme A thioesterase PaaI-like protein